MFLKYPIQPTSSSCPEDAPPNPLALPRSLAVSLFGGKCIVELDVIWEVCLRRWKPTAIRLCATTWRRCHSSMRSTAPNRVFDTISSNTNTSAECTAYGFFQLICLRYRKIR